MVDMQGHVVTRKGNSNFYDTLLTIQTSILGKCLQASIKVSHAGKAFSRATKHVRLNKLVKKHKKYVTPQLGPNSKLTILSLPTLARKRGIKPTEKITLLKLT